MNMPNYDWLDIWYSRNDMTPVWINFYKLLYTQVKIKTLRNHAI
jgi:hypothetical protein